MDEEIKKMMKKVDDFEKHVRELIREELSRLHEELGESLETSWTSKGVLKPLYSVREEGKDYLIYVDMPNVDEGSIELKFVENKVVVTAKLRETLKLSDWPFRGEGTSFKEYQGIIELPFRIDPSKVSVRKRKGMLELRITRE